jgi:hypothetical protein
MLLLVLFYHVCVWAFLKGLLRFLRCYRLTSWSVETIQETLVDFVGSAVVDLKKKAVMMIMNRMFQVALIWFLFAVVGL